MAKAQLKTRETEASVEAFIAAQPDAQRRADCEALVALMGRAVKAPAKMWGSSIIGFGTTTLKYASGRELDWMRCGFSPRKGDISLYLNCAPGQHAGLLAKLGKHRTGKGCLYVKRLADVDLKVLEELVRECV